MYNMSQGVDKCYGEKKQEEGEEVAAWKGKRGNFK